MEWDWEFVREIMPTLLDGLRITLLATLLGSVLAAAAGLGFALLRRSKSRAVARITGFVVEFIRGTPLLVQLYFLFYVLPELGLLLSPLTAGVVGLGLHYATYTSEVFRAGIDNTPRGQWEAAKACNLTPYQTWRHVILPQAIPPMIPALANYFVAMFKETPLLSAITVIELMSEARSVANSNYRYLEPMTLVGILFLCISLIAVPALHMLERRFRPTR
ncbi:ectoine/hydroxyectoine ABC transporter permease subunit EhuD [Azospirillum sp. CT11-132]|jgi:polar amino acid transport system permease protein|uniref:ectoine/hydroxyectoine ABC transporter permease subunit EhuD n=1 Tax=unclassified Azospirillum TaxID=2630922 RepID=UPI0010AA6C3B|nr:ectoine/hydroxyectoine ABC transporter permease subunit EhuD [Azospirillum sp. TSA2s]QCG93533.1 ectoine/hydroxyectoine ABC transporter permease subunit EhuD [Azospirillum sp. TSA2s]